MVKVGVFGDYNQLICMSIIPDICIGQFAIDIDNKLKLTRIEKREVFWQIDIYQKSICMHYAAIKE